MVNPLTGTLGPDLGPLVLPTSPGVPSIDQLLQEFIANKIKPRDKYFYGNPTHMERVFVGVSFGTRAPPLVVHGPWVGDRMLEIGARYLSAFHRIEWGDRGPETDHLGTTLIEAVTQDETQALVLGPILASSILSKIDYRRTWAITNGWLLEWIRRARLNPDINERTKTLGRALARKAHRDEAEDNTQSTPTPNPEDPMKAGAAQRIAPSKEPLLPPRDKYVSVDSAGREVVSWANPVLEDFVRWHVSRGTPRGLIADLMQISPKAIMNKVNRMDREEKLPHKGKPTQLHLEEMERRVKALRAAEEIEDDEPAEEQAAIPWTQPQTAPAPAPAPAPETPAEPVAQEPPPVIAPAMPNVLRMPQVQPSDATVAKTAAELCLAARKMLSELRAYIEMVDGDGAETQHAGYQDLEAKVTACAKVLEPAALEAQIQAMDPDEMRKLLVDLLRRA